MAKYNLKKKVLQVALCAALLVSLFAGCNGGGGTSQQQSGTSQEGSGSASSTAPAEGDSTGPVEISIFVEFNTPNPPSPDNDVQKLIEEKTNTKLNFMWQSASNWRDKLSVLLAAGDLADLTKINEPSNTGYLQLASRDVFWDVSPYLPDYPNLMEYPEEVYKNVQYKGKQYLIPSIRPMEGASFLAIRKDWLDDLGMDMPETVDDLYAALLAFTQNDMNGSGRNDTIGYNGRNWALILQIFNMANSDAAYVDLWKVEDGHMVDATFSDETVQALQWLKNAYEDGILIPEFASAQNGEKEEMAMGNNTGMTADTVEGVFRSTEVCRTMKEDADFRPFDYIEGPLGKFAPRNTGVAGSYVIPKDTVDETKMRAILNLLDFGATEEGFELACWGIEGQHFTTDENGFRTQTELGVSENIAQSTYGKVLARYDPYLWAVRVGMDYDTYLKNRDVIDARSEISTPRDIFGLVSDSYTKSGTEYRTKKEDIMVQVIMGDPIETWIDYTETLKNDAVYMAMTEEFDAAYQERIGS